MTLNREYVKTCNDEFQDTSLVFCGMIGVACVSLEKYHETVIFGF
jgi:hypothetical protein